MKVSKAGATAFAAHVEMLLWKASILALVTFRRVIKEDSKLYAINSP